MERIPAQFTVGAKLMFLVPWLFILFFTCFFSLVPGAIVADALVGEDVEGALSGLWLLTVALTGLAINAALVWLILAIRGRVYKHTYALVSPLGVELYDHLGAVQRMQWRDVIGIGRVRTSGNTPMGGGAVEQLGALAAQRAVAATQHQIFHSANGLLGWAELDLPEPVPRRWRSQLEAMRRNPATGKYEAGVAFAIFGAVDRSNPLIVRAYHYCPDIFRTS